MAKAEETLVIAELTHRTLHALRAVNGTIEAGGECVVENKQSVAALIAAVVPAERPDAFQVASIWPDDTDWHLSTETEAFLDRSGDSLLTVAAGSRGGLRDPFAYAACNADNGRPVSSEGNGKWVLASSARDSLDDVAESLAGHRVDWGRASPAALARVGAIADTLRGFGKGSVALWDLGAERSHLLLVNANGIEGVAPCAVGMATVFEAVQSALKLKFRGAGARLFCNDNYDFTEAGPKVCAIVGPAFKQAFGLLPRAESVPVLACIGLTGKQSWFLRELAGLVGSSVWAPDLAKLAANLGLKFADEAAAASFSPASVGLFETLSARIRGKDTWQPAWVEAEVPPEDVAEEPDPAQKVVPFVPPGAAFRAKPSLPQEGAGPPPPLAPKPKPLAYGPGGESPEEPVLEPPPGAAAFAPVSPAPTHPEGFNPPPAPPAGTTPAFPLPGTAPAFPLVRRGPTPAVAMPKPAVPTLPFEASHPKLPVLEEPEEGGARPKSKVGFYVGTIAGAALVFAVIAVVVDARMEKIKEHDLAQQEALAHHLAEVRLKEAERIVKENADQSRKAAEAAIALTQKKTEDATRRQVLAEVEAQRVSQLPGTLLLSTAPAGAAVSIDGGAPLTSPVTLGGIPPGTHSIRVSLEGHDPVELSAEIKGSKTTDLGTVRLESSLGTLALASNPTDLEFALRPAADPTGRPISTGRTPATLTGIARGSYLVTFERPGCHDHVEKVVVKKGAQVSVETKYLNGSLELTSEPSGAWVEKDGMRLGSTPLILHDLTPKTASFELSLPGYDPTPISCEIPEGQTLKLTARLPRRDRTFNPGEVKTLPVSYLSPPPELTAAQRRMDAEVTVSLVVQRDGTVVNVKVETATDDDIGRRCASAVSRWKFHPGTASDDRTVDVNLEVPFKFSGASP
jgi:TonB family protein